MKTTGTFNKALRHERQDHYHILDKKLIPLTIHGKDYLFYDNVNLSIFTNEYCNANCNFCVAKLRYYNDGLEFAKPRIEDPDEYFKKLHTILEIVFPLNPSVSITGGEPSKDVRLPEILRILKKHGVRKRTMTTNGSGLLDKIAPLQETLMARLIEYQLEHLNISRAHFDETENSRLMNFNELSNKDLEHIIKTAKRNHIRPRLSCVLLKEGIGTLAEMKEYMHWASSIGVDNVVFRQLMKFNENTINESAVSRYSSVNAINLIPLWEEIGKDNEFSFLHQLLGYYYYVEVYNYRGLDMVTEMADLRMIEMQEKKWLDATHGIPVVNEMVFHPNGNLCGSWREWKNVLIS